MLKHSNAEFVLTQYRFQDDRLGCCHLRCSELAFRDSRIAKEWFHSWIHDRRHGSYVVFILALAAPY